MADAAARDWSTRQRAAWWAKFSGTVVAALLGLGGLAKMAGVTVDVQSRSEARAQHEELRHESDAKLEKAVGKVESAINRLGERIDTVMADNARRRK